MWMRVISGCVLVVTLNVPGAYAQRDTRPTNQLLGTGTRADAVVGVLYIAGEHFGTEAPSVKLNGGSSSVLSSSATALTVRSCWSRGRDLPVDRSQWRRYDGIRRLQRGHWNIGCAGPARASRRKRSTRTCWTAWTRGTTRSARTRWRWSHRVLPTG